MAQEQTFGWNDIEQIAIALHEAEPRLDPLTVRFTALRQMVKALADFIPEPGHTVNEQILEAIQVAWHEEFADAQGPSDDPDDDDQPGYTPINPYR